VNVVPASVGRGEAVVLVGAAEPAGAAEAVGRAGAVVVTGAGPVGVGVVEHPTDSAATAHSAPTAAAARATLVI
jgi:hypothetical protein